jgi:hypothetical protein
MFILGMYANANARLINKQLNQKQTTMTTQQINTAIDVQSSNNLKSPIMDFLDDMQEQLDKDPNAAYRLQQYIWEGGYSDYWFDMVHPNNSEAYTDHPVFPQVQSWYIETYV